MAWGRRGGGDGTNLTFGFGNHGTWGAAFAGADSTRAAFAAGGSPTLGQWHHLVYTYDRADRDLYSDGVQTYSEAVALGTHAGHHWINLGAHKTVAPGRYRIDEASRVRSHWRTCAFTPGVLSPAEVASNFQVGILQTSEPPVSNNDAYDATEDTPRTVDAPGVLANDANPSGLPLTAIIDESPAHGTVSLSPNGSFLYEPAANFHGTDSFTYHASSGGVPSAPATVDDPGSVGL